MSVEVLIKNGFDETGEGPHWDEDSQTLYFVDNLAKRLFRWNYKTHALETIQLAQAATFVIPRKKGGMVIGYGKTVSCINWETKEVSVIAEVDQNVDTRMNDGKCDPRGRLWHNGYRSFTSDNKTMYFIDSVPGKVYGFDYDINHGKISNRRVVVDFEAIGTLGLPDGMTIDTEDKIWVACYDAAKVVRFDPQIGKQMQTIDFPAKRMTSCCFGGSNFDELFVTNGRSGATEQELNNYPLSGSLFRVKNLVAKGLKPNIFEG